MSEKIKHNPLLDRITMPGETFTLPSGGLFYKNGEVSDDVVNGEIHVLPMNGMDEIVMKSPDMLYSGAAITEVFGRCIPQIKDIDQMLSKDIDFLMICLRKVTFGDKIELHDTHDCKEAKEHVYQIDVMDFIKASKSLNPTKISKDYIIKFENGQIAKTEPIRFRSFIDMMQINQQIKEVHTPENIKNVMFSTYKGVIAAIDDIEDKDQISEWLDIVPAGWLKQISQNIEKTSGWGPTFTAKVKCKDCNKQMEITAPLNPISFFT